MSSIIELSTDKSGITMADENFFVLKAAETQRQYIKRLDNFMKFLGLTGTIEEKCNVLYPMAKDRPLFESQLMRFRQFQKERIKNNSIRKEYKKIPKDEYRYMKIIPITFSTSHRYMLAYSKQMLESDSIRIHPQFEKLIMSLNTALEEDGKLYKYRTSYNDVYDAFRLALIRYQPQRYRGSEI